MFLDHAKDVIERRQFFSTFSLKNDHFLCFQNVVYRKIFRLPELFIIPARYRMFEVWIYSAKLIVEDSNSITMCILDNKFSIFCEKFMRKILLALFTSEC